MSDSRFEGRFEGRGDRGDSRYEGKSDRSGGSSSRDSSGGKRSGSRSTKYRNDFSGDQIFDYRDPVSMSRFITDGGKITPARISKLSLSQQRRVAGAVKKARNLGLLPVGSAAYDRFFRAEPLSVVPFEL